jgi:deazaflavin-dependent oxidoreductase (nitroreductase family)
MWFMNRIFNPIMRWILTSPLHKIASKGVVLLCFTGRKSMKHYSTPVQYIQADQVLWIMVGFPEKKQWWRNLTGGAPVNLCLRGEWVSGEAYALKGEDDRAGIVEGLTHEIAKYPSLRKKYGDISTSDFLLTGIVMVKVVLD